MYTLDFVFTLYFLGDVYVFVFTKNLVIFIVFVIEKVSSFCISNLYSVDGMEDHVEQNAVICLFVECQRLKVMQSHIYQRRSIPCCCATEWFQFHSLILPNLITWKFNRSSFRRIFLYLHYYFDDTYRESGHCRGYKGSSFVWIDNGAVMSE